MTIRTGPDVRQVAPVEGGVLSRRPLLPCLPPLLSNLSLIIGVETEVQERRWRQPINLAACIKPGPALHALPDLQSLLDTISSIQLLTWTWNLEACLTT